MPDIYYSREGNVATILLNRPKRKNAFTMGMIDDWLTARLDFRRWQTLERCVSMICHKLRGGTT